VLVKAVFDEVRAYMRNRGAYETGSTRPFELSKADLEALIPVVTGKMPMVAQTHRASDIRQVLKLAREENVKVIIEGGDEAWIVAGDLARAGVPVVLDALQDLPNSFEQVNATLENAGRLEKAGVTVAIKGSNGGTFRVRELRYNAGNAVANGMSWSGGLAAITINPARIFGVADRVGSLEVGKDADVVVWSGDPLEPMSDALQVFIQGREQPLRSRMEELAERYRDLKRATPPAYH
jgi:imidazolonepropionase-like amidohydrolase